MNGLSGVSRFLSCLPLPGHNCPTVQWPTLLWMDCVLALRFTPTECLPRWQKDSPPRPPLFKPATRRLTNCSRHQPSTSRRPNSSRRLHPPTKNYRSLPPPKDPPTNLTPTDRSRAITTAQGCLLFSCRLYGSCTANTCQQWSHRDPDAESKLSSHLGCARAAE